MQPNLAQVLSTLAHEIRTPLAVSQGYLQLYLDGRLTTPDDQQRALRQAREALGVIATLCADASKVAALSEVAAPTLLDRLDVPALVSALTSSIELAGAAWPVTALPAARIATNAPNDLIRAVAVMARAACDEESTAAHAIDVQGEPDALVIRAGTVAAVAALPATADAPGAAPVSVERGGRGLSLIWAMFVLQQHRIHTWRHDDHKASVGFRIPLVTA